MTVSTLSAAADRGARASSIPGQIGPWEPVGVLGEGALATVFRARPVESAAHRPGHYALKVLHRRWAEDSAAVTTFCREAEVGQSVSHPHLISVLGAQLQGWPFYLVMPFLPGRTLGQRLAQGERFAPPVALWMVRQVAEALQALHDNGWLHLDVKPSNIIVSPVGHVTLLDLGFARRSGEAGSIADRPVLGTLNYLAPEMLTSSLAADARTDIYSLGVTLFELLTGELPFAGSDIGELVTQQRQGLPRKLPLLMPNLPAGVVRLVARMLAKEPLRRPQTAEGLIRRLVGLEIESLPERIPA